MERSRGRRVRPHAQPALSRRHEALRREVQAVRERVGSATEAQHGSCWPVCVTCQWPSLCQVASIVSEFLAGGAGSDVADALLDLMEAGAPLPLPLPAEEVRVGS